MSELDAALAILAAGRVVVVPTDTVYGLAADPASTDGVRAVFTLKQRPPDKALPVLGAGVDELRAVAELGPREATLAARYWPGPLTLVCRRAEGFVYDLGGDDDGTIAVRVPDCRVLLDLLRSSGPLAVTSANSSGADPAPTVAAARALFGAGVGAYVDGGHRAGEPSTIVSMVGAPKLLRRGAAPWDEIAQMLIE